MECLATGQDDSQSANELAIVKADLQLARVLLLRVLVRIEDRNPNLAGEIRKFLASH